VALVAGHLDVKPAQGEVRLVVIDLTLFHLPPASGIMTAGTVLAEPVFVRILVTVRTLLVL
jgi:putative effector of murein hydrolase LrgA (UPF0299 family)